MIWIKIEKVIAAIRKKLSQQEWTIEKHEREHRINSDPAPRPNNIWELREECGRRWKLF